jgi:hypothetical protein
MKYERLRFIEIFQDFLRGYTMQAESKQQLFDAWHTHNRVNIYLLEAMTPEMFASKISPKAQRTVADLFAYIYAIRLMWLKENAEGLLEGLPRLDPKKLDIPALKNAFEKSAWSMEEFFQRAMDGGRMAEIIRSRLCRTLFLMNPTIAARF